MPHIVIVSRGKLEQRFLILPSQSWLSNHTQASPSTYGLRESQHRREQEAASHEAEAIAVGVTDNKSSAHRSALDMLLKRTHSRVVVAAAAAAGTCSA